MVKTEKFYKLGPKICPPPRFWEGKIRATPGYGRRLGLPLSYPWTQRTLSDPQVRLLALLWCKIGIFRYFVIYW